MIFNERYVTRENIDIVQKNVFRHVIIYLTSDTSAKDMASTYMYINWFIVA